MLDGKVSRRSPDARARFVHPIPLEAIKLRSNRVPHSGFARGAEQRSDTGRIPRGHSFMMPFGEAKA